ncbi:hypothetical protein OPQ81_009958 [Rhizoctonia solani]|nr:hypothetical protein OPQ81_009958 [Rhizoctonia solani]
MRKVNLQVMRPWITKKVVELVGFEDEVVVEYAMGLLEDQSKPPDPKVMQINLTGFLESKTPAFMSALWTLLLEAQNSPAGVPASFVQEKKEELRQKHEADERALAEARRRGEHDLRLDEIRQRERGERGERRGRGGGRGGGDSFRGRTRDSGWGNRGGGGGRGGDRGPRRRSPSGSRSRDSSPSRHKDSPRGPTTSRSASPNTRKRRRSDAGVDVQPLSIKGAASGKKSRWDEEEKEDEKALNERVENELRENLLRQKVVRSRKGRRGSEGTD